MSFDGLIERWRDDAADYQSRCEHENVSESNGTSGIHSRCEDCGLEGFVSYAAAYGVSNADFI